MQPYELMKNRRQILPCLMGAKDFSVVFATLSPVSGIYSRYSISIFNLEGEDAPEIWREA